MAFRSTPHHVGLEARLHGGFWKDGAANCGHGGLQLPRASQTPQRPRTSTALRLSPLPSGVHAKAVEGEPVAGAGHVSTIRGMRRSTPTRLNDILSLSPKEADCLPRRSWEFMASWAVAPERSSDADDSTSDTELPRRRSTPQQSIRVRRSRRPADFGANLGQGSSRQRVHSVCVDTVGKADGRNSTSAVASQGTSAQLGRCSSVPQMGTVKSDQETGKVAKAQAVATLQRLFFEEMSKGGQDASGAAARALQRLSEVPLDIPNPKVVDAGIAIHAEESDHQPCLTFCDTTPRFPTGGHQSYPVDLLTREESILTVASEEEEPEFAMTTPLAARPSPAVRPSRMGSRIAVA